MRCEGKQHRGLKFGDRQAVEHFLGALGNVAIAQETDDQR